MPALYRIGGQPSNLCDTRAYLKKIVTDMGHDYSRENDCLSQREICPMKNASSLVTLVTLLLVTTTASYAGRKHTEEPGSTASLVTSISPGASGTETVNISDDTPFVVTPQTTIVIDSKPATAAGIQVGMKVISRTASDSSAPEIDLKTVPADPKAKKSSS